MVQLKQTKNCCSWNSNEECVYFSQHGLHQPGEIFEVRNSCSLHLVMPIITSWFENVLLSFIANVDLAEVLKVCVMILFSKSSWSLSFQSKITLEEALINSLAEWDGCTVTCKYKKAFFFFLLNYFRNSSVCLDKLTLLLPKINTALENYLVPSALG